MTPEQQLQEKKILSTNRRFLLDLDEDSETCNNILLNSPERRVVRRALPGEVMQAQAVLAEFATAFATVSHAYNQEHRS